MDGKLINDGDVVEGVVLLQKGDNSDATLEGIHAKVKELNDHILPPGVKIVPFLDRSDLLHLTTKTVLDNLTIGILLVALILFLFLGNLRGALIVAITIPFALLFASICLDLRHIPANLLSLGALDFGMVVEGAVVMVENIVRHLSHKRQPGKPVLTQIREAAHEVQRPVFYAITIIITAYLPIFTLQSVEGRLFKPMAWTVAFALLGSLIFSMLLAPVLASFVFPNGASEWENPVMRWLTTRYRDSSIWAIDHKIAPFAAAGAMLALGGFLAFSGVIGSEFLPHLDEGAIWVRGSLAASTGPTESLAIANKTRILLSSFPEVTQVISQIGRPDDGTDTTGFFNTEYFVDLKPKDKWRPAFHKDKDELISAMDRELEKTPGVVWNFSQPISDNVEEAVSGVKGELAVKLYGTDLKTLEAKGNQIVQVMSTVPGVADLGLFHVIGQPNLDYVVDREAAARYGINVADIQAAIEGAVGGTIATAALANSRLAIANGTTDPTLEGEYDRSGTYNSAGFSLNIPLRLFDRNQGNKETARFQANASRFSETAARFQVISDVDQAWVGYVQSKHLSDRFSAHYLDESRDVLSIAQYAFEHGGIALIDYLDALRGARATTLDALNAYQQTWLAIHQLSAASATELTP